MKILHSIVVTLLVIYNASCNSREPEKTGLEGQPMPDFTLLLPDSSTYSNTKGFALNRPEVLFYYNPRCPYCRAQMDDIVEDMEKLKNISFYLVTNSSFTEMKEFNKEYNLSKYSNIINGKDLKNHLADYYEIHGVPFTAIYGKNKKLHKVFVGKIYSSHIKKAALH
jgi:peroxiredoxin